MTAADVRKAEFARLRADGIYPCKISVRKGTPIAYISSKDALKIIDTCAEICRWDPQLRKHVVTMYDYTIRGKFLTTSTTEVPGIEDEVRTYTAIDNSTGDAWTEDFLMESTALKWLIDEYLDVETARSHDVDAFREMARVRWGKGEEIEAWLLKKGMIG